MMDQAPENLNLAGYLNTPQGRTCRFDSSKTPKTIKGLYTDNFSGCNLIILYFVDEKGIRISLTHADPSITEEHIQREIHWAGSNCLKLVVNKGGSDANIVFEMVLPHLQDDFKIHRLNESVKAITIEPIANPSIHSLINEALHIYEQDTSLPPLLIGPNEWRITCLYKLNLFLTAGHTEILEHQRLYFDGIMWQPLMKHDQELSFIAQQRFRSLGINRQTPIICLMHQLRKMMENNYSDYQYWFPPHRDLDNLGDSLFRIAPYFQQWLHHNNMESIFKINAKDAIVSWKKDIKTSNEYSYFESLMKVLNDHALVYTKINELVNRETQYHLSDFKKNIRGEVKNCSDFYKIFQIYWTHQQADFYKSLIYKINDSENKVYLKNATYTQYLKCESEDDATFMIAAFTDLKNDTAINPAIREKLTISAQAQKIKDNKQDIFPKGSILISISLPKTSLMPTKQSFLTAMSQALEIHSKHVLCKSIVTINELSNEPVHTVNEGKQEEHIFNFNSN